MIASILIGGWFIQRCVLKIEFYVTELGEVLGFSEFAGVCVIRPFGAFLSDPCLSLPI
jgi:hypothetical protein